MINLHSTMKAQLMLKPEDEIRILADRIHRSLQRAKQQGVTCGLEAMAGVKLALDWVLCDPQSEMIMDLCKAGLAVEEASLKPRNPTHSNN